MKGAQTAAKGVCLIQAKRIKRSSTPQSITTLQYVYSSHIGFDVFNGFPFIFYNFLVLCRKNLPFFPNLSAMANNEVLI